MNVCSPGMGSETHHICRQREYFILQSSPAAALWVWGLPRRREVQSPCSCGPPHQDLSWCGEYLKSNTNGQAVEYDLTSCGDQSSKILPICLCWFNTYIWQVLCFYFLNLLQQLLLYIYISIAIITIKMLVGLIIQFPYNHIPFWLVMAVMCSLYINAATHSFVD